MGAVFFSIFFIPFLLICAFGVEKYIEKAEGRKFEKEMNKRPWYRGYQESK